MKAHLLPWLLLATLLAACGDDAPTPAADMAQDMTAADMTPDLMADMDALDQDTPDLEPDLAPDMDAPDMDAPDQDAPDMMMGGMALDGFGALTGDCQVLDDELTSTSPSYFAGVLDFGMDPYDMSDLNKLTPGGQYIAQVPNAGGDSVLSEVFAFEILARCEGAKLLKTETEVDYVNEMGKITDLLVEIDGQKIGVSVVRAIAFPFEQPYPPSEADRILRKKLGDIPLSSANVTEQDRWVKQILSVIAYTPQHAQEIRAAWDALEPAVRGDTILYVTATEGDDRPLYNIQ